MNTFVEPNDTIYDSVYTNIVGEGFYSTSGEIGDNFNLGSLEDDDDGFSFDSFVDFTANYGDYYYVGVSSYSNFDYDPFTEGSGSGSSTGTYDLYINVFDV